MFMVFAVGEACPPEAEKRLQEYGKVVRIPADVSLAPPVQGHIDMIFFPWKGRLYCSSEYYERNREETDRLCALTDMTAVPVLCERGAGYPYDVGFNALCLEDREIIICRSSSFAVRPADALIVDTRQGYAGCSSLYAAGTVISADQSVLKAAVTAGVDVWPVPERGILLPGYDTGFIGGCCGVYRDSIFVVGDTSESDVGQSLERFCLSHSLRLISIYNGPLTDIGGIKIFPGPLQSCALGV